MKKLSVLLVVLLALLSVVVNSIHLGVPLPLSPCQGGDDCVWDFLNLNTDVVKIALITPPSGAVDQEYCDQVARSKAAGLSVFAVVKTNLGKRPLVDIKAEIDLYLNLYKVVGILFDEIPLDCSFSDYYRELYAYVHANVNVNGLVILNAGVGCPECFGLLGDILTVFDSTYADYKKFIPSPWFLNYPVTKFWHIVHGVTRQQQRACVLRSLKKRAGFLYISPNQPRLLDLDADLDLDLDILGHGDLIDLNLDLFLQLRLLRLIDIDANVDANIRL
jgi:hypothetical protein